MKRCIRITVYGAIQGVGYHEYVQQQATACGIEGNIQNLNEHSVLINAVGRADALDDFIDHVYTGSPQSGVEEVAIEISATPKDFRGVFRIIGSD